MGMLGYVFVFFLFFSEIFISNTFGAGRDFVGLLPEFYRGARAQAMGNAFTALADDADAIFYNPAGIAFNSGVQLRLMNPKIDASADNLVVYNDMKEISSGGFNADALNRLFGKNLYLNTTLFPSILLPHFTMGYYGDLQFHASLNNPSLPRFDVEYYYTHGPIAGVGFESKGFGAGQYFRYGVAGKVLSRRGYRGSVPIIQFVTNTSDLAKTLISESGTGYGFDIGFQYELPLSRFVDFALGWAWHDIGDTRFGSNLMNNRPPPILSNMTAGGALVVSLLRNHFDLKITMDARHLTRSDIDSRKKLHFGTELGLGLVSVQAGLNQLHWTAGVSANLWLLELSALTYAVETMPEWGMGVERRYMAQVTFKIDASSGKGRSSASPEVKKRPGTLRR